MSNDADAPLVVTSTHTEKMKDRERRRMLGEALPEMHRISCPHCQIGAAVVDVHRSGSGAQIPAGEKVRCLTCRKYFEIAVRIKLYGKKILD